jgi:TIR domain-containing protein/pentapeptide repeat protein
MIGALLIPSLRDTSEGDVANPEHVELVRQGKEAIDAWHEEHPDERLDLSEADLSRGNLGRAYLNSADFSFADLREANLNGADLGFADLREADLTETHLNGADFAFANLHKAVFCRTILARTNFRSADLSGADFSEGKCHLATFSDVDLSSAIGLESITHVGPSTIGIDTLYKSGGKIPEAFLRGCGVPENLITFLPSLLGKAVDFYSCFISYSHADKSFARRLRDGLQGRGIRCWLDEHQVLPGDDLYEQVDRGIRLWDKVLLCCSEASLTSWWVEREIDRAFKKEMELKKDRGASVLAIIPLDLDGHFMSWDHPHAAALQKRMAADFTDWASDSGKFEQQFERVVEALRTDDGGREPAPEPQL